MSAQLDDKRRLKLAAQGLRKTAISLQAAVVSLLQTADALSAETDDNLVENNPLDINLQDFLKGDINNALIKLLNDALNNEGEVLDDDRRPQQNGKRAANGVKKPTRKPRPPRDPNAPTKPQNAFILFQKDIASQVKAENAGKPWSEIVHLISTRWKALPKEEREVYEHKFEAAKQTYEAELKIYMKNKDQETAAVDPDGHEEHNGSSESSTAESQTTASQSDEEDEDDTPNPSISRVSRSKVAKSSVSAKNTPHPNPESSSKKKSKKRKPQDDDDNESAHEEEDHYELSKKSKKKASNEEGGEVRGKDHKKSKKISREEDIDMDDKFKKKKNKKN